MTTALTALQAKRQHAIKTLALSTLTDIESLWQKLGLTIDYRVVKPAKVGMVMVRARTGTDGLVYNQGEMTVARCVLQDKQSGHMGVGYTQGRSLTKARLMAMVDLGMQDECYRKQIVQQLITPLARKITEQHQQTQQETKATQVDFFTMIRGD